MKKIFRRFLGLAVVLGAGASLGQASTISYWVDVFGAITTAQLCAGPCPNHTSATLASGGGPDVPLTIPMFNQAGNAAEGTPSANHIFSLTNVALTLDWAATGNVTVFNFFSSNIPFNNAQAATLMTLTSDGTQVVANGVAATGAGTAVCCNIINGTPVFLGSTTFNGLTGSGSNSQNSLNFGFYYGNTTYTSSLHTDAVAVSGTSSDPHAASLAYQGGGQMGAIMSITYSYTETAVPEPLTFGLVGSALVGLGLVARRKRANKA